MAFKKRTHTCGELNSAHVEKSVILNGWVARHRDLGKGLIFVDLRDRFGITQLVFDPVKHPEAKQMRAEWVLSVEGVVKPRLDKEGRASIEILVEDFTVLSQSNTPPFEIREAFEEQGDVNEDLRLRYRFLDIRRGKVAKILAMRHKVMLAMRNFLDSKGFLEINTPILGKPTTETGARDYLVPSRIYPGNFFALPQSPQLSKQLLMMSGMDRYFQIAPCFRDEDLRADRQPEFMQLDIEMSFAQPDDLKAMMEELIGMLFKTIINVDLPKPIERMDYAHAVEHYGSDRPDLRFEMKLVRVDAIAKESEFGVFKSALESGGCVKALCVKGGADMNRKKIDELTAFVAKLGLKGLGFMKYESGAFVSNIVKFFSDEQLKELKELLQVEEGDIVLFGAGTEKCVNQSLDHLRRHLGKERKLYDPNSFRFLWVENFPMFSRDAQTGQIQAEHHPFTSPRESDIHLLETDPDKIVAEAYDLVLNGYELGGGSKRIFSGELQDRVFKTLGLSEKEIADRFGFFIEALKFGTPPHLGIALGIERVVMLLAGTDNIRDVVAFPKTAKANDLLFESPAGVPPGQLVDLTLQLTKPATVIPWGDHT